MINLKKSIISESFFEYDLFANFCPLKHKGPHLERCRPGHLSNFLKSLAYRFRSARFLCRGDFFLPSPIQPKTSLTLNGYRMKCQPSPTIESLFFGPRPALTTALCASGILQPLFASAEKLDSRSLRLAASPSMTMIRSFFKPPHLPINTSPPSKVKGRPRSRAALLFHYLNPGFAPGPHQLL